MAFCDALLDHADEVRVVLVDRRPAAGGHWVDAYPFVRLHQASSFYGVASILLGDGRVQQTGPEAGLHERATGAEVRAYYARVLARLTSPRADSTSSPAAPTRGTDGSRRWSQGSSTTSRRAAGSSTRATCRRKSLRHAAAVRGRGRRPGDTGERPARRGRRAPASTSSSARGRPRPTPASGCSQRRRPGRDLLGPTARSLDAQPGRRAARPEVFMGMAADTIRRQPRPSWTTCS